MHVLILLVKNNRIHQLKFILFLIPCIDNKICIKLNEKYFNFSIKQYIKYYSDAIVVVKN